MTRTATRGYGRACAGRRCGGRAAKRDCCFSRWRRERLPGVHGSTRRANPGRHVRFRHRLAHARPARTREHEFPAGLFRASRRLSVSAFFTVCVTPTCVRFAPSGATRWIDCGMRGTDLRMEHRDADEGGARRFAYSRGPGRSSLPNRAASRKSRGHCAALSSRSARIMATLLRVAAERS